MECVGEEDQELLGGCVAVLKLEDVGPLLPRFHNPLGE